MDARQDFLDYLHSTDYLNRLMATWTFMSIGLGNPQELYTYMGTYEKYPYVQNRNAYIDSEVYTLFASRYPDAYKIYQKVYNMASY